MHAIVRAASESTFAPPRRDRAYFITLLVVGQFVGTPTIFFFANKHENKHFNGASNIGEIWKKWQYYRVLLEVMRIDGCEWILKGNDFCNGLSSKKLLATPTITPTNFSKIHQHKRKNF